jgi:integrase
MVRAKFEGVNTITKTLADGSKRIYYYHRTTKKRLNGKPGSAEFIRNYASAENYLEIYNSGVLNSLIRDYAVSPEFGKLADSTQREYRRMLNKVEAEFGTMPLAALEDPRVRQDFMKWRANIAITSGEREADNRLSIISAMLSWAKENGQVFSNHIAGFRRLHKVDRSDMIWLPEHIAAFMAVAPIELQRALILALHTGQRQGDLLRLSWSNLSDGWISLRQGKSARSGVAGRKVEFPCSQALLNNLKGFPRNSTLMLVTKTGLPWKPRHFKSEWEKASKAAGITDLHFHDLRGTAITMLAEAGCTAPQIASITGHSLKTVSTTLDKYLARTRALAGEAVILLEGAKSSQFANRLQTATPTKEKGSAK